ncbi:MAG: class I SAM-dependent methyltransferase [Saprospiraceae bacterium]|nr:class I SAM-dependent methyltransferase [Saprospiraceae bacterium]
MRSERFLSLLHKELEVHPELRGYYRFLNDPHKQSFRTAYYLQRLRYIERALPTIGDYVWDCGCGYGTTNFFLALNGIRSFGNTLEYYYEQIPRRREYWSAYGDVSLFECDYANTFDLDPAPNTYSTVIVQDTLHHLEPLDKALLLFFRSLQPGGQLVAIEENGSNIIQQLKLFRQRGTRRVIEIDDTRLGKKILMGNENIRSVRAWQHAFKQAGFVWDDGSLEYLRILPSGAFSDNDQDAVIAREQRIIARYPVLRKYLSFGINFIARKPAPAARR